MAVDRGKRPGFFGSSFVEDGVRGEAREYSRIANTPAALARLAGKVGRDTVKLRFCFEAGPCGYGMHRRL